jgi:hypothetical protein
MLGYANYLVCDVTGYALDLKAVFLPKTDLSYSCSPYPFDI